MITVETLLREQSNQVGRDSSKELVAPVVGTCHQKVCIVCSTTLESKRVHQSMQPSIHHTDKKHSFRLNCATHLEAKSLNTQHFKHELLTRYVLQLPTNEIIESLGSCLCRTGIRKM